MDEGGGLGVGELGGGRARWSYCVPRCNSPPPFPRSHFTLDDDDGRGREFVMPHALFGLTSYICCKRKRTLSSINVGRVDYMGIWMETKRTLAVFADNQISAANKHFAGHNI